MVVPALCLIRIRAKPETFRLDNFTLASHVFDCNGFGDCTNHRINILSFLQCEIVIDCSVADNANLISNMAIHPLRDRGATLHVSSQQSMDVYPTGRLRTGSALS